MHGRDRLAQTRDRLARWRAEHGGPGIRVPEAMWAEVVEIARVEGVEATARAGGAWTDHAAWRRGGVAAGGEARGDVEGGFVDPSVSQGVRHFTDGDHRNRRIAIAETIVDETIAVLTAGAHFMAIKRRLSERFLSVGSILGCFWARWALPTASEAG